MRLTCWQGRPAFSTNCSLTQELHTCHERKGASRFGTMGISQSRGPRGTLIRMGITKELQGSLFRLISKGWHIQAAGIQQKCSKRNSNTLRLMHSLTEGGFVMAARTAYVCIFTLTPPRNHIYLHPRNHNEHPPSCRPLHSPEP